MSHLAFAFCCFIWGTTFILLERVTHVFGPVEIAIWRMFLGAAAVGFFWWLRPGAFRMNRRDWRNMVLLALIATGPAQVVQAYVLAQGFGHSFFGTAVAVIPLLTILVSVPLLGIRPSGREIIGVLGGLACLWLLVGDGINRGMSAGLLALTFIVPLSSALSNTFIKWKLPHVEAIPLTAVLLAVAATSLLPLQFSSTALEALHIAGPANTSITPTTALFLLLLGVVGSGISTMVFIWMILKEGPLFAGMTTYVVPVLALLWGCLDHESISLQQVAAIGGVLAMVMLVQTGPRRMEAVIEEMPTLEPASLPMPQVTDHKVAKPAALERKCTEARSQSLAS